MSEHDEVSVLKKSLQTEKSTMRRQQLLKRLWKLRQRGEGAATPLTPSPAADHRQAGNDGNGPSRAEQHAVAAGSTT